MRLKIAVSVVRSRPWAPFALQGAAAFAILFACFAYPAHADEAEDFEICSGRRSVPNDERLRVCDRLIDSNMSLQKKALAYCNRSIAHRVNGNQAEAMKDVDTSVSLNSDPYSSLLCRAFQYDYSGEFDRALADYDKAIAFDQRRHEAYIGRGRVYMRKNDPTHALDDFKKATNIDPKSSIAFTGRGSAEFQLKIYDEAIESFTTSIRLDPKRVAAYEGRGSAYKAKGDEEHAKSDFAEALRIKTGH